MSLNTEAPRQTDVPFYVCLIEQMVQSILTKGENR